MNTLNKLVGFMANPLFAGIVIVAVAVGFVLARKRKAAMWTLFLALAWFWFWSMPVVSRWLAVPLEEDYPVTLAEEMPKADAIVLMGGGAWGNENYPYACLCEGADRACHAARLWKAGKAPVVIPSCIGAEYGDARFLLDLGIPAEAVVLENKARNTEENARFIHDVLGNEEHAERVEGRRTRILLVTSASHMRRSLYMFKKYAPDIECIPAATDYAALPWKNEPLDLRAFLPSIGAFASNNSFLHEYIGYYGYRWFR